MCTNENTRLGPRGGDPASIACQLWETQGGFLCLGVVGCETGLWVAPAPCVHSGTEGLNLSTGKTMDPNTRHVPDTEALDNKIDT